MTPWPPALTSPPATYDFDAEHRGIPIPMFLNDRMNDCVIAARAHHTLRLAFGSSASTLNISDDEVSTEYYHETGGRDTGLVLRKSLGQWRDEGWTAGGQPARTIKSFTGPMTLNGAGLRAGDPVSDFSQTQLMACIVQNTGVQVDLRLPRSISVSDPSSFGKSTVWTDISAPRFQRHIMLLVGYNAQGPIGITWGQKQFMTWQFLQKYCLGAYWIEKNDKT